MLSARWRLRSPSLRQKVTAAFALSMALVLVGLGLFVYSRFQAGLDTSINRDLRSRAGVVRALVLQSNSGLADAGQGPLGSAGAGFAQILTLRGQVFDATAGLARRPLLSRAELAAAGVRPLVIADRTIPALGGPVRILASAVMAQGERLVSVVGASLHDRDASLADLRAVILIGGPLALALASLLGYGASALSLRAVEAMRRQARELSVAQPGRRVAVPPSGDELSRLAETINEMLARNESAFERERRFTADASHELRGPLAVLRAELEVALIGSSSPAELRAVVASAAEEADRLSQLAEDLLLLAQSDHGTLPVDVHTVAVLESFARVRDRFAQRARIARRAIVTSVPDGLTVRADPARLAQALSNLVDNALRYGEGNVVLTAEERGETVELHVADFGPGFPGGFAEHAFERFSRADAVRGDGGAGLGLSIVASIARAHDGAACVANRPGGGANCWIVLPRPPAGDAAT